MGSHLLDPAVGDDVRALRAVLKVSQAVLGARRFSDALEVIAEQTRAALGAASFSISRWERERGVLHTMINVGDLGPGEQRWPTDEEYPLADYRDVIDLLRQGRPYVATLDDDDIDPAIESLLRRLNKYSELAVPVMYEGTMWGELWASGADGRRFGPDDVDCCRPSPRRYRWLSARPNSSARCRGTPTRIPSPDSPIDEDSMSTCANCRTAGRARPAGMRPRWLEGGQRPGGPHRRGCAVARRGRCPQRGRLGLPGVAGRTYGR